MSYGDNIRKLRKVNHMNQTELGKLLNVSNKAISSWESDRTEPNMEMINAMESILLPPLYIHPITYTEKREDISIFPSSQIFL